MTTPKKRPRLRVGSGKKVHVGFKPGGTVTMCGRSGPAVYPHIGTEKRVTCWRCNDAVTAEIAARRRDAEQLRPFIEGANHLPDLTRRFP